MRDPTLEEMREFLAPLAQQLEANDFDIEGAIYWFAYDHHGGQGTNLYSALSQSQFHPGVNCNGPETDSIESYLLGELVAEYVQ